MYRDVSNVGCLELDVEGAFELLLLFFNSPPWLDDETFDFGLVVAGLAGVDCCIAVPLVVLLDTGVSKFEFPLRFG